jgi:hypothetical protein
VHPNFELTIYYPLRAPEVRNLFGKISKFAIQLLTNIQPVTTNQTAKSAFPVLPNLIFQERTHVADAIEADSRQLIMRPAVVSQIIDGMQSTHHEWHTVIKFQLHTTITASLSLWIDKFTLVSRSGAHC